MLKKHLFLIGILLFASNSTLPADGNSRKKSTAAIVATAINEMTWDFVMPLIAYGICAKHHYHENKSFLSTDGLLFALAAKIICTTPRNHIQRIINHVTDQENNEEQATPACS